MLVKLMSKICEIKYIYYKADKIITDSEIVIKNFFINLSELCSKLFINNLKNVIYIEKYTFESYKNYWVIISSKNLSELAILNCVSQLCLINSTLNANKSISKNTNFICLEKVIKNRGIK